MPTDAAPQVFSTYYWAQDGQHIFTTEAIIVKALDGHSVPIPRT